MSSQTSHEDQMVSDVRRVFFSQAVPLIRGQGLCWQISYATTNTGETATDSWGKRGSTVVVPTRSLSHVFAGVTTTAYRAKEGGQWVDIYLPGSVCEVAIGKSVTASSGFLTCSVGTGDAGLFSREGMHGKGSMIPLSTNTSATLVRVANGSGSMLVATLTDSGAFGSVVAGDFVYLIGGGVAATGIQDATGVFGKYIVATAATNTLVLKAALSADGHDNATTAAPNFTAATAVDYYVMSGQQYCMAKLHDGPESGCQEYLGVSDAEETLAMVFGTTYIGGTGTTCGAPPDVTIDFQGGGGPKRFVCEGGPSTGNAQTITPGTIAGIASNGTQFVSLTVVASGDHATLHFDASGRTFSMGGTDMSEA